MKKRIKNKNKKELIFLISNIIIFFLVVIDLITKYFFTNKDYFNEFFISIEFSKNFGSGFSLFSNIRYYNIFIILLSIIILIIYYLFINFKKNTFSKNNNKIIYKSSIFVFLISGIIGNLYDRIFFGYVRDFIYLKHFFIFNFADIYLTISFILYLYLEINLNKSKKIKNKNRNHF